MRLNISILVALCFVLASCGSGEGRVQNTKLSNEKMKEIQDKAHGRETEELGAAQNE